MRFLDGDTKRSRVSNSGFHPLWDMQTEPAVSDSNEFASPINAGYALMKLAGKALFRRVRKILGEDAEGKSVAIFVGGGNNGGDGLAIARLLSKAGFSDISVFLFNTRNQLSDDCRENSEKLQQECPQVTFSEITQQFETPKLDEDTLVIDALFGIGLKKPLNGGFASLVKLINSSPAEVVSIDIPSGLLCEDNSFNTPSTIVNADHTLTLHAPKLSLLLDDTLPYVGEMHLLPIGISPKTEEKIESAFHLTTAEDIRGMWKKRPVYGHKGTFGHALLVAGSYLNRNYH